MKINTLLMPLALGGIILTGCSPTYNIEPSYDKQKKTIMIDDYKIDYVSYDKSKNILQDLGLNVQTTYKIFKAEDEQCRKLAYRVQSIGSNGYYYTSALDDILRRYNNNCKIEQIGNINFFSCVAKSKINKDNNTIEAKNIHYGATSSGSNQDGYSDKTTLFLGNSKNCFENIKEHFAKKTKPEYIKTTKKMEFNKNIKFYTGKLTPTDNLCFKNGGGLEFYIDSNNVIKGNLSFTSNRTGKQYRPIIGKIVNQNITIERQGYYIFNGTKNNNIISGNYKRLKGKNCYGTFKVKLNK